MQQEQDIPPEEGKLDVEILDEILIYSEDEYDLRVDALIKRMKADAKRFREESEELTRRIMAGEEI